MKNMSSSSCKNVINKKGFTNHIYLIYMYKKDVVLNNQQTQPNQRSEKQDKE